MKAKKIGLATGVLLTAGMVAACGGSNGEPQDSPVNFVPVTGDNFTANPGAFQTDGIAVPPKEVMMVGDPVAAQAVVNAGLPQGTITSTSQNTTVYYPPVPDDIPGVRVDPQPAVPQPMSRPANYRPWQYTPQQIDTFRTICETGRWGSWIAGVERQTQTCWSLYGRQLGVRPWTPGQPRPWDRPGYPKPWFDPGFRSDVPVMWVYPRNWTRPKPQPIISVSITINIGTNPFRRVNPRHTEPFYPVWAVTPGRVVDVRNQGRIVAPVYTVSTTTTTTTTTTVTAPVAPGVVLAPMPTSAKVEPIVALPGAAVAGNVNTDVKVTAPVPAALQGAQIQAGSVAKLDEAIGTSVSATVASTAKAVTSEAKAATSERTTTAQATGAQTSGTQTSAAPGTAGGGTAPAATSTGASVPTGARVAPPSGAGEAPSTTAAAPTTTVPTTVAPPVQTTTVAPPPVQTTVPTTTVAPPPVQTTVPVPTTTVAPPVVRTTVPVPTTTVAPPPVRTTVPVPTTTVAPPVVRTTVPKPTVAKPIVTTTTPPPAAEE